MGMFLLESKTNLEILNKCAITSSATDCEDAAGVLITISPLSRAYSTSILSIPTPPLPIILTDLQWSIISFLTCVALLTKITSIEFSFM